MPLLLYTYLATEVLAPFFASLVVLCGILFLGRLIPILDVILDFGISFGDFVRLCAYLFPKLLLFAVPMASMMGVIIGFNRLVADNEIIALKAAGIGLFRMLPPVLVIALATASLTALTSLQLIPAGSNAVRQLLFHLAKEKIDKGLREKQFSQSLGPLVVYADRVDPESRRWQGVYVSDLRNPRTPVTVLARSGSLTGRLDKMEVVLELNDGSLHRAPDRRTQTVRFDRYTVTVPLQAPATVLGESATGIDRTGLDLKGLLATAKRIGADTQDGRGLIVEYHKRLALAVGCFILTLLALPLALFTRHGRRPMGLPLGLGCFILYYVALTGASGFCEAGTLPVGPLIWLPNLFFAGLAAFLIHRVGWERSSPLLARLPGLFEGLADRLGRRRPPTGGAT